MSGGSPRVVVTGAARGIGQAVAHRLAGDGWAVVVVDRDPAIVDVADGLPGAHHEAAVLDVADFDAVDALAGRLGEVDALVNNAGIWRLATLSDSSPEDLRAVIEVNLIGTIAMTRALSPLLAEAPRGAVVNLSSAAVRTASPGLGSYAASKAGIEVLTRQWALELAPVRVNAIAPGLIVTEGTAPGHEGERGRRRAAAVPVGRTGLPADIAAIVCWLLGPEAGYVNGQIITVDGGLSAGTAAR